MKCYIKVTSKVKPAANGTCPVCDSAGFALSRAGYVGAHEITDPHTVAALDDPKIINVTPQHKRIYAAGIKGRRAAALVGLKLQAADAGKGHTATPVVGAVAEVVTMGKCMIGPDDVRTPITVKDAVAPVAGSVRDAAVGQTGTCPECGAHVPLSTRTGVITAHNVRMGPTPASKALVSRSVEPTDTGSRVGDPYTGDRRRGVEVDGLSERGTVEIRVKDANGKVKITEVPATLPNLRIAYAYELKRKPRAAASKAAQSEAVSRLRRQIDAAMDGAKRVAGTSCETDVNRGAAFVKGGNGRAMASPVNKPETPLEDIDRRKGWAASAGTMGQPLGRDRVDHDASVVPGALMAGGKHGTLTVAEVGKLTEGKRRRYWRNVKARRDAAERGAARRAQKPAVTRDIAPGLVGRSVYGGADVTDMGSATHGRTKSKHLGSSNR